jgi:hypothetical protein
MPLVDDVTVYFADFGEEITVDYVPTTAIFDLSTELQLGDVLQQAPSVLVPSTVVAVVGSAVVARSVNYTVRQVLDEPPDSVLRRLVLARS